MDLSHFNKACNHHPNVYLLVPFHHKVYVDSSNVCGCAFKEVCIAQVLMCKKATPSIIFFFLFQGKLEIKIWWKKCLLNSRGAGDFQMSWYGDVSSNVQKPEEQLLISPLSKWELLPLRPPAEPASSDPWSVWPDTSFRRWTVHPLFCHSGTCWGTQWVWSGFSAECPRWAESCLGWPQTPN